MNLDHIRQVGFRLGGRLAERVGRIDAVTLQRIVLLGVLLRVVLLAVTAGSNDIVKWEKFGRQIADWGVLEEYRRTARFNHPPLMGIWGVTAVWISDHGVVPFRVAFKLLPFAADMLGLWLIWSLARKHGGELHAWRTAAVFSTSLVSIVITGHHGNTDSACAMLALVAAALIADGRRPLLAGLALAAALNVKLIPLVLLPAVLLLRDVRAMMRFGAGLALGLVPFLPLLMYAGEAFYRNVVGYQPGSNRWGVHFLLSLAFDLPVVGSRARSIDAEYFALGRYVIMAACLGLGVWARRSKRSAVELAALLFAMFLLLAPGIGVQYLAVILPVLVMTDPRRAAIWGFVAGLFVTAVYLHFRSDWFPFRSMHRDLIPVSIGWIGLVAWLLLLEFTWSRLRHPSGGLVSEKEADAAATSQVRLGVR